MERTQRVAMAVADTILFLRRNGRQDKATFLSEFAVEQGVNPAPLAAAWLEDISA